MDGGEGTGRQRESAWERGSERRRGKGVQGENGGESKH